MSQWRKRKRGSARQIGRPFKTSSDPYMFSGIEPRYTLVARAWIGEEAVPTSKEYGRHKDLTVEQARQLIKSNPRYDFDVYDSKGNRISLWSEQGRPFRSGKSGAVINKVTTKKQTDKMGITRKFYKDGELVGFYTIKEGNVECWGFNVKEATDDFAESFVIRSGDMKAHSLIDIAIQAQSYLHPHTKVVMDYLGKDYDVAYT